MKELFERFKAQFLKAYQIRAVETKLLELFQQGKLNGTVHTSIGQEVSAVLVAECLQEADVVFSNHRCHGHYIAKTGDVEGLLAEIMGKNNGVCRGFGGSQHLCGKGFFSNGIQGGIVPVSAGIALHQKRKQNDAISVVYLGDGTLGEGVVYETLNLASKWQLPLLFVVEDNRYAQSTASHQTLAGSIPGRAAAFDIPCYEGSIWELSALQQAVYSAVREVREQQAPALLKIDLYRLAAHSKGDDDRDAQEIQSYRDRDPLTRFLITGQGCDATQQELLGIDREIEAIVQRTEQEPVCPALLEPTDENEPSTGEVAVAPESLTQMKAINQALNALLRSDPQALILGEDIHSPYGGAFKVTRGLSEHYPGQVLTTPISEAAIVGMANGLALMQTKVVAEIMFGDFITLAFDQILNHAAKFKQMYGTDKHLPLVIRTPMGGGRGYGPTHSQSLEKHLAGIPGTELFVLHGRTRVLPFYETLLEQVDTPSLVIENKVLYGKAGDRDLPPGYDLYETRDRYPTTLLKTGATPDLTLVAFGGLSSVAEQVAVQLDEEEEIVTDLLFPLRVYPLNIEPILRSVEQTRCLVVLEEGTAGYDFGSEVISRVTTCWDNPHPFRARKVAAKATVIPSAVPLEKRVLPDASKLREVCLEIYGFVE